MIQKTERHNRIRFAIGASEVKSKGKGLEFCLFLPFSLTVHEVYISLSLSNPEDSSLNKARRRGLGRGLVKQGPWKQFSPGTAFD